MANTSMLDFIMLKMVNEFYDVKVRPVLYDNLPLDVVVDERRTRDWNENEIYLINKQLDERRIEYK